MAQFDATALDRIRVPSLGLNNHFARRIDAGDVTCHLRQAFDCYSRTDPYLQHDCKTGTSVAIFVHVFEPN